MPSAQRLLPLGVLHIPISESGTTLGSRYLNGQNAGRYHSRIVLKSQHSFWVTLYKPHSSLGITYSIGSNCPNGHCVEKLGTHHSGYQQPTNVPWDLYFRNHLEQSNVGFKRLHSSMWKILPEIMRRIYHHSKVFKVMIRCSTLM